MKGTEPTESPKYQIRSPLQLLNDNTKDKTISQFRTTQFKVGDQIDYYTFNMNLKTQKDKKSMAKLKANRVTFRAMGATESQSDGS